MIDTLSRRSLLLGLGALGVTPPAFAGTKAHIVVVGGGFGGATAAKMLVRLLPAANITLIEPNPTYIACPFSNLVIAGQRTITEQEFGYETLKTLSVNVVHDWVHDIDAEQQTIALKNGGSIDYDKLVLSPGIDIRWNALDGYDQAASRLMPHAWKAGAQTSLLHAQLSAMEDGGLVVMSVPTAPFRCPPGPYERASLIAHFLKTQKPKSKLIILDAKNSFSKMPLFMEAWAEHYPDHLEWRGVDDDGVVTRVNSKQNRVETNFEIFTPAVTNVIPPQKAASVADKAGVTDTTGWCPVNALNFASTLAANIHVIGDATIAAPMPKSAFSANLQAKICAISIARELSGLSVEPTTLMNTCYSYTSPNTAISISGVYSNNDGALNSITGAGGLSPLNANTDVRIKEAEQAKDWFRAVTQEAFA